MASELHSIRDLLETETSLRKDCSGLVASYLAPLPFLDDLEAKTHDVRRCLNILGYLCAGPFDWRRGQPYFVISRRCMYSAAWTICFHWYCQHK